ncbi:MAG TPA: class I SAM-dependent methyltransferase [Solirubrobacteraceae bacterium]|nr:class I SAM-dependent methyltransferase [Solirubrobacteraceae bacterium]
MSQRHAQRFWDEAARENALFFVDNRLDYRDPDLDRLWAGGVEAVDSMLGAVGLTVAPEDVVVEIGCGVGRLTRVLAERAARVVALDISAEMLDRARELNPQLENVEWRHGDGASLAGVPEASADGCFSHVVFQHIPDPAVTLTYVREMGRVLRPGGWSVFQLSTAPVHHRPGDLRGRVAWRARALLRRGPRRQEHPAWLGSCVSVEELGAAAAAGGMLVERLVDRGTKFTTVLLRRHPA